jgi:hypothetical protein
MTEGKTTTWQDWSRYLENEIGDQENGSMEVTGTDMRKIIHEEIRMMRRGTYPRSLDNRPFPDPSEEPGAEKVEQNIDSEWYDLFSEGYHSYEVFFPFENSGSSDFVGYNSDTPGLPHQGWKLRVAAYMDEAREVCEAVLPYLQRNDISHKVMTDRHTMRIAEETRQEGKLITIYPSLEPDMIGEVIREVETDSDNIQAQVFKEGNQSYNRTSINSNVERAASIIQDLESILSGTEPGLRGRSINGEHGEERQYGDTRIHMRYAVDTLPAVIERDGGREVIDDTSVYVDVDGETISGRYRGDEIDAAVRPDSQL